MYRGSRSSFVQRVVERRIDVLLERCVEGSIVEDLLNTLPREEAQAGLERNEIGDGPPAHRDPQVLSALHFTQDLSDVVAQLPLGDLSVRRRHATTVADACTTPVTLYNQQMTRPKGP